MIDYKGLEALAAIIESNSFETASRKLCITQPAISQRLKSLQHYYGDPLILRGGDTYSPTPLCEVLIAHYKKIKVLETSLKSTLEQSDFAHKFSIGVNRDALETWFMQVILENHFLEKYTIDIITVDQEHTLELLKNGVASICLSTQKTPMINCKSELLGFMNYVLVCNKTFKKKYFSKGVDKKSILLAKTLKYDKNDFLYENYLKKYFDLHEEKPDCHIIPSVKGFKEAVLQGYVCALIPELDVKLEIKNQTLINIMPDKIWRMPFYLHSWQLGNPVYENFIKELGQGATRFLEPC